MGTQTRQYDFITGPETDSLPTIGAPTLDDDLVTLGYADSHYTQGKEAVADVAALKAIPNSGDTARVDRDVVFVDSKNALYQFDSGASDTGDDNLVITPTSGSGRWIKLAKSSEHITNLGSSGGTITDDGRYSTFLASDGGATPTVYLPTIADNDGRTITIIKNGTSDISNSSCDATPLLKSRPFNGARIRDAWKMGCLVVARDSRYYALYGPCERLFRQRRL